MDDEEATYLDERPTLRLPPINVVGIVKMVPDVEHLAHTTICERTFSQTYEFMEVYHPNSGFCSTIHLSVYPFIYNPKKHCIPG
jgi:hypothetical protein